jgi:hypothetical protein
MKNRKQSIANILQESVLSRVNNASVELCMDKKVISEKIGEGLLYLGLLPALLENNPDIFKDQKHLDYAKDLEDISVQVYLVLNDYLSKKIYQENHKSESLQLTIN